MLSDIDEKFLKIFMEDWEGCEHLNFIKNRVMTFFPRFSIAVPVLNDKEGRDYIVLDDVPSISDHSIMIDKNRDMSVFVRAYYQDIYSISKSIIILRGYGEPSDIDFDAFNYSSGLNATIANILRLIQFDNEIYDGYIEHIYESSDINTVGHVLEILSSLDDEFRDRCVKHSKEVRLETEILYATIYTLLPIHQKNAYYIDRYGSCDIKSNIPGVKTLNSMVTKVNKRGDEYVTELRYNHSVQFIYSDSSVLRKNTDNWEII